MLPHLPRLEASATHLWFGWRRGTERDLADYAARWPAQVRFVAEFGSQSLPATAAFLDADSWPVFDGDALARSHTYEAASFDTYVPPHGHASLESWREATQLYQAGLLRRQIETLRRLKYRPTGGFCIHHLIDAEPTVSAALVEADGTEKLAYQAVVEACRPVIVVADRLPPRLEPGAAFALDVHVINDLREGLIDGVVDVELRGRPGTTGGAMAVTWRPTRWPGWARCPGSCPTPPGWSRSPCADRPAHRCEPLRLHDPSVGADARMALLARHGLEFTRDVGTSPMLERGCSVRVQVDGGAGQHASQDPAAAQDELFLAEVAVLGSNRLDVLVVSIGGEPRMARSASWRATSAGEASPT